MIAQLLFSQIDSLMLWFLGVHVQVIVTVPDSCACTDFSVNVSSLMDGSLKVQMLLYKKKERREEGEHISLGCSSAEL